MADPVAIVETIVKLGLQIKDAVETVRYNQEECQEINECVATCSAILWQLQQKVVSEGSPALSIALEGLEKGLQQALDLVTACNDTSTIRRLITAGDQSKQLRRVKEAILIKVLLASLAINAHTVPAGVHPHLPSQQPEDAGLVEESHSSQSTNDARSQLDDVQTNVLAGREPSFSVGAKFVDVVAAWFEIILLKKQKRRKLVNIHGGEVSKAGGICIFTKRQLKNITNNYSDRIGGGFFGDVYKGIIKDDGGQEKHVAVKRNVATKEALMNGVVNEIIFQFQMTHPNMVRLVGCCLETDIPILVSEFISNGSLEDKLHSANKYCTLSLLQRIDIAIGSAEALSYMHSHGQYEHVHGDIKPANILLDENFNAKISNFFLDPADASYVDPVYITTEHFTQKSDVYSFGVVLLELITRKKARYNGNCSLPMDFEKAWNDEIERRSMYDTDILSNGLHPIKCLDMVGALAVRCLNPDQDERPTMGEVVAELKNVKSIACGGSCSEASGTEPVLDEASKDAGSD